MVGKKDIVNVEFISVRNTWWVRFCMAENGEAKAKRSERG